MRGALCRSLLRTCFQQRAQAADVARVPVRQLFWWGHDTLEDKEERKKAAQAKGVIAWTDPESALEEKKEFVWSPQRIEDEIGAAIEEKGKGGIFNPADLLYYVRNKLMKPYLPMAMIDPIWFREETKKKTKRFLVRNQMFVRERLVTLGPDLAAAHFLCFNNCRVRFRGHTHWTELQADNTLDIPATYVPGWHVEAIDAAEAMLVYEGLQNLRNLHHLKELDLSYCPHIDEWCMDRITGEFHHTLEHLNISGCINVNWNALEVVWRCSKLKVLVIKDMDHIQDLPLICLMLLDVIPGLKIMGAEYMDITLLEGTEHEYLLADDGSVPRVEAGPVLEMSKEKEEEQASTVKATEALNEDRKETDKKDRSESVTEKLFNIRNPLPQKASVP